MSSEIESVVFVEGYADRAFWAQWLESRLGWTVERDPRTRTPLVTNDPWGRQVKGAAWGFHKRDEKNESRFLRVVRAGDDETVRSKVLSRIDERDRGLRTLLWCVNSDEAASAASATASRQASFDDALMAKGASPSKDASRAGYSLDWDAEMRPTVRLVVWHTPDPPGSLGVPEQQTIERIVCAAIAAAYPDRVAPLSAFLAADPVSADVAAHKAHAGAYYAKWHATNGVEELYRQVWRDKAIADALEARLRTIGAWAAAESL